MMSSTVVVFETPVGLTTTFSMSTPPKSSASSLNAVQEGQQGLRGSSCRAYLIGTGVGVAIGGDADNLDVYRAAIECVGWAYRFCEELNSIASWRC